MKINSLNEHHLLVVFRKSRQADVDEIQWRKDLISSERSSSKVKTQ